MKSSRRSNLLSICTQIGFFAFVKEHKPKVAMVTSLLLQATGYRLLTSSSRSHARTCLNPYRGFSIFLDLYSWVLLGFDFDYVRSIHRWWMHGWARTRACARKAQPGCLWALYTHIRKHESPVRITGLQNREGGLSARSTGRPGSLDVSPNGWQLLCAECFERIRRGIGIGICLLSCSEALVAEYQNRYENKVRFEWCRGKCVSS